MDKKDCPFCDKKGLMILPLRYSVAVADDVGKELGAIPALPGHLGDGVKDLNLTQGKYVPAMLRAGYLYVLIERKTIKSWEGYFVTDDAYLYKFDVETPPVTRIEFTCDPTTCGIDASMVSIDKASDVEKVYFLFTPSPLTKAKLKEYKADPDGLVAKKKMQVFNPKAWLAGNKQQPHALDAPTMRKHTLEWILFDQGKQAVTSALGKRQSTQHFPPLADAYGDRGENTGKQCPLFTSRLAPLHTNITQRHAAGLVLYDPIGITQELNDFRNAPLEGLQRYLAATDGLGASNLHRMQVHEAIEEIRVGLENGVVRSAQEFIDNGMISSDMLFDQDKELAQQMRASGHTADAEALERRIENNLTARAESKQKILDEAKVEGPRKWRTKYLNRLDEDEMDLFRKTLEARTRKAFETADQRAPDHLKWFTSKPLLAAFDAYDSKDVSSGHSFALQSGLCSFGMSGCKSNDAALDEWIKAVTIEHKNIYMRGLVYNQTELIEAVGKTFADIKAHAATVPAASDIDGKTMLTMTKGLTKTFKAIDSGFEDWVSKQGQESAMNWARPSALGMMVGKAVGSTDLQKFGLETVLFHKFSDFTRTIFRSGIGGVFDKALTAMLTGFLHARVWPVAEKLAYNELMLQIPPEKLAEGYKGRSAERNRELQDRRVRPKAAKAAGRLENSLQDWVADAQEKAAAKTKLTLEELAASEKRPTNSYHQLRIGAIIGCIEMIGLGEKLSRFQWDDTKARLEVGGSILAIGSIVLDALASSTKPIREIEPYASMTAITAEADFAMGGFKLGAGVLSMSAGLCGASLDIMKATETEDGYLKAIYGLRGVTGAVSSAFTLVATLAACEPYLKNVAAGYAKNSLRARLLVGTGRIAVRLVIRLRLLTWIARLNVAGLLFTAAEIGYLLLKDDDLQNWCEQCVFRKPKKYRSFWTGKIATNEYFPDAVKELTALDKASQVVGITH